MTSSSNGSTKSPKQGAGVMATVKGILIVILLIIGAGAGGYFFGTYQKFAPVQYVPAGTPGSVPGSAIAPGASSPSAQAPGANASPAGSQAPAAASPVPSAAPVAPTQVVNGSGGQAGTNPQSGNNGAQAPGQPGAP